MTAMSPEFTGNAQAMALVGFSAVVTITLLLCVMTGPDRDDLDEFCTGYGSLSSLRNDLAIAGDYISAATVLGTGGVIALFGYDGIVLALSTALPLMLLMVLLAEPLRNAGRFTRADGGARPGTDRRHRVPNWRRPERAPGHRGPRSWRSETRPRARQVARGAGLT